MERTRENVKNLLKEGKSIRDIANIFGVSYTPMRLWMKRRGLQKSRVKSETASCKECNRNFKYSRKAGHRRSTCNSCLTVKRRRSLKKRAVEYMGGQCKICGYKRYMGSLAFHHLDPSKKDFGVSQRGLTRTWKTIKKELDKCVLVCHNCHNEIHAGIVKF